MIGTVAVALNNVITPYGCEMSSPTVVARFAANLQTFLNDEYGRKHT
ncbi:hypothetical protein HS1genome_1129 [Sulfodiicoccus acidiphilus]|uniref:Uncharacterized protein n=1 Tax=Sulfodiicoccus acidiphilus TaxID=1670455 RepID=A0A348B3I8_9CREN|nr:hypothetical protein [Sulfodiicoccus acidiphilus]BBD72740.1 hypothetical protein HS1genome_1129 [Sulfodiicoccus acidiphilus]GGT95156.1 hypothetical protein GCM10007116_10780 [Sulfodiicoccus acidiphilus]